MPATSPFPGMDPYLEASWRDVHTSLVTYSRDALQPRLPAGLRARVESRVSIENPFGADRGVAPDVVVYERPGRRPSRQATDVGGGVAVAEEVAVAAPLVVLIPDHEVIEYWVEVVDLQSGGRVITTIEFLSVTNKKGKGSDLFRQKQGELMIGGVNLVEIDLLRDGRRVLSLAEDVIPASHRTTYQACAWRAIRSKAFEIYRIPLRERLPVLPIPLRPGEPDARLDLQALIAQCYASGAYDDLDYSKPPVPPLEGEDAAWAEGLLKGAGRRP